MVGDLHALRWVDYNGKFDIDRLNARPVEGGNEADGTPLYIIQTRYQGSVHPGKVSSKIGGKFESSSRSSEIGCSDDDVTGGMISYGGGEQQVQVSLPMVFTVRTYGGSRNILLAGVSCLVLPLETTSISGKHHAQFMPLQRLNGI